METETLDPCPASISTAASASLSLFKACMRFVLIYFGEQTVVKFPLVNFLTPRIILALEMSFPHPPYFTLTVQKYTNTRIRFDFVFVYWHSILVTPDGPRFRSTFLPRLSLAMVVAISDVPRSVAHLRQPMSSNRRQRKQCLLHSKPRTSHTAKPSFK